MNAAEHQAHALRRVADLIGSNAGLHERDILAHPSVIVRRAAAPGCLLVDSDIGRFVMRADDGVIVH